MGKSKIKYVITWSNGNCFCENLETVALVMKRYNVRNCDVFLYNHISTAETAKLMRMVETREYLLEPENEKNFVASKGDLTERPFWTIGNYTGTVSDKMQEIERAKKQFEGYLEWLKKERTC